LSAIYLSIFQSTLVLLQAGTVSGTKPTPAIKLTQLGIFLDERDMI